MYTTPTFHGRLNLEGGRARGTGTEPSGVPPFYKRLPPRLVGRLTGSMQPCVVQNQAFVLLAWPSGQTMQAARTCEGEPRPQGDLKSSGDLLTQVTS